MTLSHSVSQGGASFRLQRSVSLGDVLHLSLPMPNRLRQFDLTDAGYRVYSSVRNVGARGPDGALVGVMLLGKYPPRGFDKGVRLLLPEDHVRFRQYPRHDVRVGLTLRRLQPGAQPGEERSVTEVLGLGGLLVPTTLPVGKGETVSVETHDGLLRSRCSVQNVTIGPENVPRLSLMFLDDTAAAGAKEVLRRHGITDPEPPPQPDQTVQPAPAPPPRAPSSVRFDKREAFAECSQEKHGSCSGWVWEAATRTLSLCRCACHAS